MDIANLLKNCPVGTKLYSPVLGKCTFLRVDLHTKNIFVSCDTIQFTFTSTGNLIISGLKEANDVECMLFPSKENRDWSTFSKMRLAEYSTEVLRAELKRRNAEEKAIRQKEFDNAHRCRNCKYFEKNPNAFLSNSHICMARTWGKHIKRHYVVNGSHGLQCKEFVHK